MNLLADRIRPSTFSEVVGQDEVISFLQTISDYDVIPSFVLWGPPGSGKTTIARIFASITNRPFVQLSGAELTISTFREHVKKFSDPGSGLFTTKQKSKIIFIDEIHRVNRAQQDAFLSYVERGDIILIGATTENPFFELTPPLLSRTKILQLKPLSESEILKIIKRATDKEFKDINFPDSLLHEIASISGGDARFALNTLELCAQNKKADISTLQSILSKGYIRYDKGKEEHYNVISAFIKSMRGSDVDAALYWLARMIEGGEDPLFIARRMVIFASEDVGNADPNALVIAIAVKQAVEFIGMPEGFIPLSQGVIYLSLAPKSNSAYTAYLKTKETALKTSHLPVPLSIRNAPVKGLEEIGYGNGYIYPHNTEQKIALQSYLPPEIQNLSFYTPNAVGFEKQMTQRYKEIKDFFKKR